MPAGYIDRPTADRLTRLADQLDEVDAAYRLAIMEAVEAGISLRAVSRAVRVSHATVRRIARHARAELDEHGRLLTTADTYQDPYGGEPRDPLDRRKPWRGDRPDIRDGDDQGQSF